MPGKATRLRVAKHCLNGDMPGPVSPVAEDAGGDLRSLGRLEIDWQVIFCL
jgi:hypothetical protein